MRHAIPAFLAALTLSSLAFADPPAAPPAPKAPVAEKADKPEPAAETPKAPEKPRAQRKLRHEREREAAEAAAAAKNGEINVEITARKKAPIVHVEIQKMPLRFSLPELVGPYGETDAPKAPLRSDGDLEVGPAPEAPADLREEVQRAVLETVLRLQRRLGPVGLGGVEDATGAIEERPAHVAS